jgi:biopolymer transport protein ExbB/TolQ
VNQSRPQEQAIVNRNLSSEFVYQLVALLVSVIVIHTVYVGLIRPNAEAILEQQAALEAAGQFTAPSRSLYVILKDYEQETCFILMFWAIAVMGYKARTITKDRSLLERRFINVSDGMSILPQDAREHSRSLQALPEEERRSLLPRALLIGLQRFGSTRNIQDVSTSIKETCESEADRLDSELSMIRYIAWAIPSIGFIGTVRGIGAALGQAHRAVEGDISGVTASLGIAFNSTFIALVISILVMFLMYQLTLLQERLVIDSQHYCENNLMAHLRIN